jgi:tetratricopeptide (TPR) repeat protein
MTEPESHDSTTETAKSVSTPDAEPPAESPEPEPEPWTPERVSEWNAYYDLYVLLGALLLAFVVSANKINQSSLWTQLKAGQLIAEQGRPLTSDPFSYTEQGRPWVNIPWLFELVHAIVHKGVRDAVPSDPTDATASASRADQFAAGVLVGLNALVRALTLLVLVCIRRPGPGLWWSAVCATLALGAILSPFSQEGLTLGGIAGSGSVTSDNWGLLLLALELLLLHWTLNLGRRKAIYGLIPLFALWANFDESFLFGLLVLAAAVIGQVGSDKTQADEKGLSLPRGLTVLGLCVLACLANPSVYRVFPAALSSFLAPFRRKGLIDNPDDISFFGREIMEIMKRMGGSWISLTLYYLIVVALGLGSFVLNRRRFSLSRFLIFTIAAVLWGALIRFAPLFAVVFAPTLALNGQEWYQSRFGTAGRLGRGWSLWSTGGRAATIVALFLLVAITLTGWFRTFGQPTFGFGYDPDNFAFEAADYLRTAPILGNVLNTNPGQGDALIWRAFPQRKVYFDSRHHLFSPAFRERLHEVRLALKDDAVERWRPLLDEYKISVVMLQGDSANTYVTLQRSPNWIPFYYDGNVALFGRADAPGADLAYFQSHSIKDPERLVFHQERTLPAPERPPTPTSRIDGIFRNRSLIRPQSHTESSARWLEVINPETGTRDLPDPARCFLAIQEARIALSRKPDDWRAYRLLKEAYRLLMLQESALLAGIKLTPEDRARLHQFEPQPGLLMNRFRQRATALNYAIQTTPPFDSPLAVRELQSLNLELYNLYRSVNFLDLARDRLRAVVTELGSLPASAEELVKSGQAAASANGLDAASRTQMTRELAQLDELINRIKQQMDDLTTEQQAGPLQRAGFAISQGAPGLAILELEEADRTGANPTAVRPQLLDLYCDTGQPDRALELLSSGNIEDPALGTEPGVSLLRQARVYSLLGNYDYAASLMERAIPQLRFERGIRALSAGQLLFKGEAQPAINALITLPAKITTQANWEYELALYRLESGAPASAAEHFTRALTLAPTLSVRPIIAYYLEKLGKPVPPAPVETPAPEPAKTEKPNEEPAKTEKPKSS